MEPSTNTPSAVPPSQTPPSAAGAPKAEKEKKREAALTPTQSAVSASAAEAIAQQGDTKSAAMEREVKQIATVDVKEVVDCLRQFFTPLITDLQSKLKGTKDESVIKGVQEILERAQKELLNPMLTQEIIERRVLIARNELVDFLISNLEENVLDNLQTPDFKSARVITELMRSPVEFTEKQKIQISPTALFNLFDNMNTRISLNYVMRLIDRAKGSGQQFVVIHNQQIRLDDATLLNLASAAINESLKEHLPDVALEILERLPLEIRKGQFTKILEYYTGPSSSYEDILKAIALEDEYPDYGVHIVKDKLFSSMEPDGILKAYQDAAMQTMDHNKAKFFTVQRQVASLGDDEGDLERARGLMPELIQLARLAFASEPSTRNVHLAMIANDLLDIGLVRLAIQVAESIPLIPENARGGKEQQELHRDFAYSYLNSGEIPLIYEWTDKLPNNIATNLFYHAATAITNLNDVAGMTELLDYCVRRGINIDAIANPLWPILNTKAHENLINLVIFYGANPEVAMQLAASEDVRNIISRAAKLRQAVFQKMLAEELKVMTDGTHMDVVNFTASFLTPENLTPEQIIDLAKRCLAYKPG